MDSRIYVANTFDATITVIDGDTFGVANVYTVGGSPSEIAVSLDGALLYVTNDDQSFVSVIDSADGTVVDTIEVGNPWAMAISADGTRLYVTSVGFSSSSSLSVIDTSTNLVLNTVPVAAEPYGVAVSADGTVAYVTSAATKTMQVVYLGVLNRAPVSSAAPTVGSPGDYGIVTGDLNMVDPEGDTLIYTVTAQPAYGTVTVNPNTGVYSYAPSLAARIAAVQSAAIETDTFTVGVSDGVNVATPVTVDGVLVAELEPNAPAAVISIPSSNPNGTSAPSGMTFSPDGTRAYIHRSQQRSVDDHRHRHRRRHRHRHDRPRRARCGRQPGRHPRLHRQLQRGHGVDHRHHQRRGERDHRRWPVGCGVQLQRGARLRHQPDRQPGDDHRGGLRHHRRHDPGRDRSRSALRSTPTRPGCTRPTTRPAPCRWST